MQPTLESLRTDRPLHIWPCSGWGLPSQLSLLNCWCALTAPFHPYLCYHTRGVAAIGGLFSVALSFELPRLAVNQHPVLWSPDLPQHSKLCCGHLVDSPSLTVCLDLLIICNEYSLVFLVPSFLDETTKHLWLEFLKESDSIKFINQQNLEILCRSEKS